MRIIIPTIKDTDALFQIELENFGVKQSTEKQTFEEIIKYPEDFKGYSLKALVCESLCGFYCTIEDTEKVEIVDIAVSKKEQGKGRGSFLLGECLNENPGKTISLTVREDNISAVKLYEKFGFEKVETIENYYESCSGIKYSKKVKNIKDNFHQITKDVPASKFLLRTLEIPDLKIGNALELGCGSGSDSIKLFKEGWKVTAIDRSDEGLEYLKRNINNSERIDIRNTSFELMELNRNFYSLVYSRYSLSFCQKPEWENVWSNIIDSLKPGGIISMHLFGVNDGFKDSLRHGEMTFFESKQIDEMMNGFEILMNHEDERDSKSAVGELKHWHVFTVVGKKL